MKALIVINTKEWQYHDAFSIRFQNVLEGCGIECQIYDMAEKKPLHEKYYDIADVKCHFLISFDCAGFELLTEGDTLSYNTFPFRMAHILFQNTDRFAKELMYQMNLSMFIYYTHQESREEILCTYPSLPNVSSFNENLFDCNAVSACDDLPSYVKDWLAVFMDEAELEW